MSFAIQDADVRYHLRDMNSKMVEAFEVAFEDYENTRISQGDIVEGAPLVDAVICPANSFGFMNGSVDKAIVKRLGHQIETRLQNLIQDEYDGELPVGNAILIPCYGPGNEEKERLPIKYLILAPTMRVPGDISNTNNTYLAFRAAILKVRDHNRFNAVDPIESVMVTGLGSGGGQMPVDRCAFQMLQAYETFALGKHTFRVKPNSVEDASADHKDLCSK